MKYVIVKTYEVLADGKEQAEELLIKLEEKNLQSLFLKSVSTTVVREEGRTGILPKLW